MIVAGTVIVVPCAQVGSQTSPTIRPVPSASRSVQRVHRTPSIRPPLANSNARGRIPISPVRSTSATSPASSRAAIAGSGSASSAAFVGCGSAAALPASGVPPLAAGSAGEEGRSSSDEPQAPRTSASRSREAARRISSAP